MHTKSKIHIRCVWKYLYKKTREIYTAYTRHRAELQQEDAVQVTRYTQVATKEGKRHAENGCNGTGHAFCCQNWIFCISIPYTTISKQKEGAFMKKHLKMFVAMMLTLALFMGTFPMAVASDDTHATETPDVSMPEVTEVLTSVDTDSALEEQSPSDEGIALQARGNHASISHFVQQI